LHFTPTNFSWPNLVERWFAKLTTRKLRRSAHRGVTELETGIRKWINEWNKNPKPFVWTKSADDILETAGEYCRRVTGLRTLDPLAKILPSRQRSSAYRAGAVRR
jgi:hypothetical protein